MEFLYFSNIVQKENLFDETVVKLNKVAVDKVFKANFARRSKKKFSETKRNHPTKFILFYV